MMSKIKMIIDCDTGIDDALAISYILSNPDIELLGITATYGNIDVDSSALNSLRIAELFGRKDIRVYKGAEHSWDCERYIKSPHLDRIHGNNGLGNVDLKGPEGRPEDMSAIDFIIECAKRYGSDLHLVCVGPLNNLALCLKKDEEAIKMIGDITIMGGALTVRGNRDIYGEANIADDPAAARYVFESPIRLNIVPLDATLKTMFRVNDIKDWSDIGPQGKALLAIAEYYYRGEYENEDVGGAMHDPLAAFASYDPSIITNWFDCNLTVEPTGRMIGTFEELNLKEKRHRVALDVDAQRFTKEYIGLVSEALRKICSK